MPILIRNYLYRAINIFDEPGVTIVVIEPRNSASVSQPLPQIQLQAKVCNNVFNRSGSISNYIARIKATSTIPTTSSESACHCEYSGLVSLYIFMIFSKLTSFDNIYSIIFIYSYLSSSFVTPSFIHSKPRAAPVTCYATAKPVLLGY